MANSLPPIALTGRLRSGKDEVAKYLVEKYGYTRFAFGDELKNDFHRRYPEIPREPKPRVGYQNHGQLMRALIGEDVWVDACFAKIAEVEFFEGTVALSRGTSSQFRAVITDLRQPNEFSRCRTEGYVIIRVTCPEDIRIERARAAGDSFTDADLRHETEQHVDTFAVDYEIDNSGSLDELHAQIDDVMTSILGDKN